MKLLLKFQISSLLVAMTLASLIVAPYVVFETTSLLWATPVFALAGYFAGRCLNVATLGATFLPMMLLCSLAAFPHVLAQHNSRSIEEARDTVTWTVYEATLFGGHIEQSPYWDSLKRWKHFCYRYPRATWRGLMTGLLASYALAFFYDRRTTRNRSLSINMLGD